MIPLLLAAGADVNAMGEGGKTPLMEAARYGVHAACQPVTTGNDPILQIYNNAAALRTLSELLAGHDNPPSGHEEGLAHLLALIVDDVRCNCSRLDDGEGTCGYVVPFAGCFSWSMLP